MMGTNNPMKINKFSWKVEYQGRGAGHIHGTLWCNLNEVRMDEDNQVNNSETLENAFKALRLEEKLSTEEEHSITQFADKFTTCTLNSDKASEHLDEYYNKSQGRNIVQIVKQCQIQHHTKTCRKKGGAQ